MKRLASNLSRKMVSDALNRPARGSYIYVHLGICFGQAGELEQRYLKVAGNAPHKQTPGHILGAYARSLYRFRDRVPVITSLGRAYEPNTMDILVPILDKAGAANELAFVIIRKAHLKSAVELDREIKMAVLNGSSRLDPLQKAFIASPKWFRRIIYLVMGMSPSWSRNVYGTALCSIFYQLPSIDCALHIQAPSFHPVSSFVHFKQKRGKKTIMELSMAFDHRFWDARHISNFGLEFEKELNA